MEDKHLYCTKCNMAFFYPIGEQNYLKSKNLQDRKKCHSCTVKKRLIKRFTYSKKIKNQCQSTEYVP